MLLINWLTNSRITFNLSLSKVFGHSTNALWLLTGVGGLNGSEINNKSLRSLTGVRFLFLSHPTLAKGQLRSSTKVLQVEELAWC